MNKQTILSRRNQRRLNARLTQPRKDDAPGGHTGTPSPSPAPNNNGGQGGNTGDSGNTGGDSNNTGDQFDAEAFWRGPAPASTNGSGGESATQGTGDSQGSGTQGQGNDLNTQLATQLQSMSFGDPLFDQTIAEEINQGNFEGANKRIQASMQQAVRQALAMNVQILRPFAEQMMQQMREEFGGTLNQRDNNEQLVKDFPAARDPRVAPGIKTIFEQALKNTNNDRVKAVAQTKQMLSVMANVTGGDLGLNVAPRGSEDNGAPQPVTNWLDELTGR